ncbi:helix-turn-helix transcriptional regulator [Streptomyces sp. NPDC002769]|uniref:AraC family transcriptional regulator n=1 Tax=Streptomyces sp. NPDC002769 TaxID=3154542 RepID=UPI00332DB230
MTSGIDTIGADHGETGTCRMPMGLDIVIADTVPAELPHEGRPSPARRHHRLVARDDGEYLFVGLRGGRVTSGPREPAELHLEPGDVCFYDARRPPALDVPGRFRTKVFLVPCESLGLDAFDVRRIACTAVPRDSRLGGLLSPFLSDLADTASSSRSPVGELLAWNAVNVLSTLAAEQLGRNANGAPDGRSPLMAGILRFIDLHLADGDLSPDAIAGAHHISARYLHRLFQDEGTTVGRWVQRRRLEECRRDLMLRGRGDRTIGAVANRWGFTSATHFSRVFRAAYGMSPSEWRESSGRGARPGRG